MVLILHNFISCIVIASWMTMMYGFMAVGLHRHSTSHSHTLREMSGRRSTPATPTKIIGHIIKKGECARGWQPAPLAIKRRDSSSKGDDEGQQAHCHHHRPHHPNHDHAQRHHLQACQMTQIYPVARDGRMGIMIEHMDTDNLIHI
jgi:hypothetical protein